jgi:hypothetical protein
MAPLQVNKEARSDQALGGDQRCFSRTETGLTIETQYVQMLLQLDCIPWWHNFLSSLAGWVLLAGYLVVPGTFTSLQKSDSLKDGMGVNIAEKAIISTVQNPPLIAIACSLLCLGAGIMAWLFWKWKDNYIWLINRLFL